ncbi:MAG TPA: hypothetical protein HA262_16135 [Methanosarcina sp.]|jgi:uncharacterized membrane protein (GlpM family)|nr:hypothetical protein [Methanosarcina sp.]
MSIFLGFLISVVIIIFQHILSESKNWLLGGIIPLLVVLFALWCFFIRTPRLGVEAIMPFSILFVLLSCYWVDGRERFKKKKKEYLENELKKIQVHDLDDYTQ